ncbi:MAG: dTDP-4-dehydrorhamnose reductase [Acidimicrobiia bacterium]|nr:MAG: dTDP-4-dehydrorhamnose reductase [Acidimicrobiia bacterium]
MIVVTGASGQLGSALRTLLGPNATYLRRTDLDLTDGDAILNSIEFLQPTMVINCAAYTAVDDAEANEDLAYRINASAVEKLAVATAEVGSGFVTLSTDYVFDGTAKGPYVESSTTQPINVYGASKLEGEHLALAANPAALVIRTSWVLSGTHPNFLATMLRLARQRPIRVVDDQIGRPTLADDLARGIQRSIDAGANGILHLTNQGTTSWYELAKEAVTIAGLDPGNISPCTTADYPTPAQRPHNSVLDSDRLEGLGIDPLPPYREGLERAVENLMRTDLV